MRAHLSVEAFSRLVGLIYDAAVDPERWPMALDAVQRELGYDHAAHGPSPRREEWRDHDARALIPHFQRAAAIGRLLDDTRGAARALTDALDGLATPVLLLAADAAILHANAAARLLLSAGTPLTARGGRLTSPAAAIARGIQQAIPECAQREGGLRHRGFGVPARDADGGVHVLHFLPLGEGAVRERPVSRAVAALFVSSPAVHAEGTADLVAALYGLTAAETRVFAQVVAGRAPRLAARTLGVAPSTFRSHLLHVYDKLGVHRQAELVRLATVLTSPLAPVPTDAGTGGRRRPGS